MKQKEPDPIWLQHARLFLGAKEVVGPQHNDVVLGFWRVLGLSHGTDEVPWCMGFVMAMLQHAGYPYLKSAWARDGLKYKGKSGKVLKLDKPAYGCIVVFSRGSGGHIGFVVGRDRNGNLMVLGGNQSNAVTIAPFDEERVLGYIWPGVLPFPERFNLPTLNSNGKLSTNEV